MSYVIDFVSKQCKNNQHSFCDSKWLGFGIQFNCECDSKWLGFGIQFNCECRCHKKKSETAEGIRLPSFAAPNKPPLELAKNG